MKIEMEKKYTSNGQPVRVVCIDRECTLEYKVIGVFDNGSVRYFGVNGESVFDSRYNLQEVLQPQKVWEPQAGEWCLFWNNEEPKSAILDKFIGMTQSGLFKDYSYSSWQYCAKFDGTIPEHLKNIKNGEI
jgi:hypothetical protein